MWRRLPDPRRDPVLINDKRSVFTIQDFVERHATFFRPTNRLKRIADRVIPSLNLNLTTKENYARYGELLLSLNPHPTVLVLGGSVVGQGMSDLLSNPAITFIDSDVSISPRIK